MWPHSSDSDTSVDNLKTYDKSVQRYHNSAIHLWKQQEKLLEEQNKRIQELEEQNKRIQELEEQNKRIQEQLARIQLNL